MERLFDEPFTTLYRKYHGGLSQLLAPLLGVFGAAAAAGAALAPCTADNCFFVRMVARARATKDGDA